jgi:non-ribosomal peptide synthetase component F
LDELVIGTPASNRNNFQVEGMVGVFINTLPLKSRISAQTTLRELIAAAQQVCSLAFSIFPFLSSHSFSSTERSRRE